MRPRSSVAVTLLSYSLRKCALGRCETMARPRGAQEEAALSPEVQRLLLYVIGGGIALMIISRVSPDILGLQWDL
jgi:hypothetical protein